MELSKNIRIFLLKIIDKNGNVEPLREFGYEYSQIISFISDEVIKNNAEHKNGKLSLTEKGKSLLGSLEEQKQVSGSKRWIEPEFQNRISKLDKNDVFLPNQDDLWFK